MKTVSVSNGRVALVDDEDYKWISRFKWHAVLMGRGFYVMRNRRISDGPGPGTILLHRAILEAPASFEVDHRNGDGLDNQRKNLRLATSQQNQRAFQRKAAGKTSRFRGVCWHKAAEKWSAQLKISRRKIHLGLFSDEEAAARAYDSAVRVAYGEFSHPNLPL